MKKLILSALLLLICNVAYSATEVKKTVCPSGCDYTGLDSAVSFFETTYPNFVTSDIYGLIEISGDWSGSSDTTIVGISGITTDSTRYFRIYTTGAARHQGVYSTSYYRLIKSENTAMLTINSINFITIDGLQIYNTNTTTSSRRGIEFAGTFTNASVNITNNIVKANVTPIRINITNSGSSVFSFINDIVLGDGGGSSLDSATFSGGTTKIYNSIIISNGSGNAVQRGAGSINVYNSYACSSSGTSYNVNGGTLTTTTSASCDSTGTSGYRNVAYSTTAGTYFTNVTAGSEDHHVTTSSSKLFSSGTDESGVYTTDIVGTTYNIPFDLGVFEIPSGSTRIGGSASYGGTVTF